MASGSAHAQFVDTSYQAAFAARVGNPSDTSALSTFIGVAVQAGQYDQALSTIEEHLINYPLDAKAHLIAARLYYHLGSRELAARHLEYALDIGTLTPSDQRTAARLLASVERALQGFTGFLDLTVGVRSTTYDFMPLAPLADRSDADPFARATGLLRYDLNTATDDALLLFGEIEVTRQFGSILLIGGGSMYRATDGRAGVALDVGLPTELIPTLRGQVSVYYDHETVQSGISRRMYGTKLRLTSVPTANIFVFVEAGYAWLGESTPILVEQQDRFDFEGGATFRIVDSHTIGIAGRGYIDYLDGFGEIGHLYEGELSYGGQVMAFESGPIWSQKMGVAIGEVETPDVVVGPAFVYNSRYWRAYWQHSLQIDDRSRVELGLRYRETEFDVFTLRDEKKFDAELSYTISLY